MGSWTSPKRWLARLSFSFFILSGFLLWEVHQARQGLLGRISSGRIVLFMVGALVSFVLGVMGVRERHKPEDDGPA